MLHKEMYAQPDSRLLAHIRERASHISLSKHTHSYTDPCMFFTPAKQADIVSRPAQLQPAT